MGSSGPMGERIGSKEKRVKNMIKMCVVFFAGGVSVETRVWSVWKESDFSPE